MIVFLKYSTMVERLPRIQKIVCSNSHSSINDHKHQAFIYEFKFFTSIFDDIFKWLKYSQALLKTIINWP